MFLNQILVFVIGLPYIKNEITCVGEACNLCPGGSKVC